MNTVRPVLNISRKVPGAKPAKVARVTFPDRVCPLEVVATIRRWPVAEGFLVDLRQHGPQGFSLPLDRAEYFAPFPGLEGYVETLLALPRVVPLEVAA